MKRTYFFLVAALYITGTQAYIVPQQLSKTYVCEDCNKLSHVPLHTHWPVGEKSLITSLPKVHKSYSYNQIITAQQLEQGIRIATSAPGAIIQITHLHNKSMPELELQTEKDQSININEIINHSIKKTKYQIMLQMNPKIGFGTFIIKSKKNTTKDVGSYLIHVYDRFSSIYLEVQPHSLHYQYGDEFKARISIKDHNNSYSIDDLHATLTSTDAHVIPLHLKKIRRNQFQASAYLISELNTHGDNWYIDTEVNSKKNKGALRRTGHTAFSYSIPSAGILNIKQISSHPLIFSARIYVATASRYALQSILFHKEKTGKILPLEMSQSVQWLDKGLKTIKFSFDNSQKLEEDTLSIGHIHLTDYGQFKTVYQYNQPIQLSQLMD